MSRYANVLIDNCGELPDHFYVSNQAVAKAP